MILLTICIPTVIGREGSFGRLHKLLSQQIFDNDLGEVVNILVDRDNKEVSIGAKRERMYRNATGVYAVQIDDDDSVSDDFVIRCYEGTLTDKDCIGYHERCNFDNRIQKLSDFSLKYDHWYQVSNPVTGFHHFRTPFCKTPIKTKLCQNVGVADLRFGEDHDFAQRIYPLLKTEHYINKVMYLYNYTSQAHNIKYGIK